MSASDYGIFQEKLKNNLLYKTYPEKIFNFKNILKRSEEKTVSFHEWMLIMSAGYGWPNLGKVVVNAQIPDSAIDMRATGMGPLHFRAEYALSDGVGFGMSVNYISFGVKFIDAPYEYKWTRSSLSVLHD